MGILVKQKYKKQTAKKSDWLIGEGLIPGIRALRSMKNPGTAYDGDNQPDHMDNYDTTTADYGGVHINSGIPNKAFYLTATEIGGNAWTKAGLIWYVVLRDRLQRFSKFQEAADSTYEVAGRLFGDNSKVQKAVRKGWKDVGIEITENIPTIVTAGKFKIK
jgi:Zn-dependent metalloprotease